MTHELVEVQLTKHYRERFQERFPNSGYTPEQILLESEPVTKRLADAITSASFSVEHRSRASETFYYLHKPTMCLSVIHLVKPNRVLATTCWQHDRNLLRKKRHGWRLATKKE